MNQLSYTNCDEPTDTLHMLVCTVLRSCTYQLSDCMRTVDWLSVQHTVRVAP